ncbi:hypothetical protein [Streptomyces kronopolitis]|uniref:hypothetical protein n=1 Tax=Streptomyces kronopolitis TaxID=1612435 RepID=UPI003D962F70
MRAHTTARTARRRTLRVAAAALTAAAALSLTACSGAKADAKNDAKNDTEAGATGRQSGGRSGGAPAAGGAKASSAVRSRRLADGVSTAEVTKLGELRYRAQIIGHDGVAATLETHQHDAGLDANGIYLVLSTSGIISAHA